MRGVGVLDVLLDIDFLGECGRDGTSQGITAK